MSDQEYTVELQIKRNGSPRAKDAKDQHNSPMKDWSTFKFVLRGQEFIPYLVDPDDNQDPQGCLKVAGCKAAKISSDADDKKFTFKLASETTAYVFNAHDSQSQEVTIALLNFAAADPDWYNPFMPNYSEAAANRIRQLYYSFRAKKTVAALKALYPHLYLVSVNRVVQESEHKVFAYVSGLVTQGTSIERTVLPVCVSSTPEIKADGSFHVGVVAYPTALSHISVSVVNVKDKGKAQQTSLGTAFVPLSQVPERSSTVTYTSFSAVLPLEAHSLPAFSLSVGNGVRGVGPTAPPTSPLTLAGHSKPTTGAKDDEDLRSIASTIPADPHHHRYHDTATVDGDRVEQSNVDTSNNNIKTDSALTSTTLLRAASSGAMLMQGKVSLCVYTPSPHRTMSGWLLKKSDSWLMGGAFRPYYFVLMNGELQYFQQAKHNSSASSDSVLTLDQPKKLLFCANVTAVEEKGDTICVSFKQNNTRGVWKLRVLDANTNHTASTTSTSTSDSPLLAAGRPSVQALQRMWVRKLLRCCPALEDPALRAAATVGLFSLADRKLSSGGTGGSSPSSVALTGVDVSSVDTGAESLVGSFNKERRASIRI